MQDRKLKHRFQTDYQLHFFPVELCISDKHKLTDNEAWEEELPTGLCPRPTPGPTMPFTPYRVYGLIGSAEEAQTNESPPTPLYDILLRSRAWTCNNVFAHLIENVQFLARICTRIRYTMSRELIVFFLHLDAKSFHSCIRQKRDVPLAS